MSVIVGRLSYSDNIIFPWQSYVKYIMVKAVQQNRHGHGRSKMEDFAIKWKVLNWFTELYTESWYERVLTFIYLKLFPSISTEEH